MYLETSILSVVFETHDVFKYGFCCLSSSVCITTIAALLAKDQAGKIDIVSFQL